MEILTYLTKASGPVEANRGLISPINAQLICVDAYLAHRIIEHIHELRANTAASCARTLANIGQFRVIVVDAATRRPSQAIDQGTDTPWMQRDAGGNT